MDSMEAPASAPAYATDSALAVPASLSASKVAEYFFLAATIGFGALGILVPDEQRAVIAAALSLAIFIFLFLLNHSAFSISSSAASRVALRQKASLYLATNDPNVTTSTINSAREKALLYCQELIEDYKKTRGWARILYYVLQMTTIVFSGVTPILVLVDKLEAGQNWLRWLPVICPAIASIVASVVTSFPFQKNWIAANRAVELLEAEQEKFILGITQSYRCYDTVDEKEQQLKAQQAIENFIVQVNIIHLQLLSESENSRKDEQQQIQNEQYASNAGR